MTGAPSERDVTSDLVDVPAAVVCARCGFADCLGCETADASRSGIVAIVPWERPMTSTLGRLWATARMTTRDADQFFEVLPDGPVLPALRFAALCELVAASAVALVLATAAAVIAPAWARSLASDADARAAALRFAIVGLPALAAVLVAAHAAHGLSIDLGAGRSGVRSARTRALRFGLYACGWDLVMGPVGVVVIAAREGLASVRELLAISAGVPGRATRAFLRGTYRLDGDRAHRSLVVSYVGAAIATVAAASAVLALLVLLFG